MKTRGAPVPNLNPDEIPLLQPTAKLPLHVEPGGWAATPWIEFDDSRGLLYMFQQIEYIGVGGWLRWHAPAMAIFVAMLVLVLALRRVRRVIRTPRRRGSCYCRICNYDLTPQTSVARCPECGCDLVRRPAVHGRGWLRRMLPACILAVLLLTGCAIVVGSTLTLRAQGAPWDRPWPVPLVQRMGPLGGLARKSRDWTAPTRITVHALPEGTPRRLLMTRRLAGQMAGRLSPDGRWIIAIRDWSYEHAHPGGSIELINPLSGAVRTVGFPRGFSYPQFVAFSSDGQSVFVQSQSRVTTPSATRKVALQEIHLPSASVRTIAEVEPGHNGGDHFAIHQGSGGELAWALYVHRGISGTGGVQANIVVPRGQDQHSFAIEFSGRSFYWPRLTDGGRTLEIPAFGSNIVARVDLDSGTVAEVPLPAYQWWAWGPPLPIPHLTGRAAPRGADEIEIQRESDGAVVARLAGMGGQGGRPLVSPTGAWAAVWYYTSEPTFWSRIDLALPRQKQELWIWDLRGVPK